MIMIIKSLFYPIYIALPHHPLPDNNPFYPFKKAEKTRNESSTQEIRREKVYSPQSMTTKEIMKKYNISESSASTTRKRGWFIKNYGRN
jgi:hypothetical protein